MSDADRQHEPPQGAPPTVAAPLAPHAPPTAWPRIIGILAIVFGSLAVIGGVWSFVSLAFLPQLLELMAPVAQSTPPPTNLMRNSVVFQGITSLPLGALLLFAGIAMRRRQKRSVRLSRIWALVKLPVVVIGSWIAIPIQQTSFNAIPQSPGGAPPGFLSLLLWLTVAITVLWGCALPVFMLIWFSRRTVKAETATWS